MRSALAMTLALLACPAAISGRSSPPPLQAPLATAFDAASVKPNDSGERGSFNPRPGRFATDNLPVRALLGYAYGVRDFQIEGGPDWINQDRFDIVASMRADSFRNVNIMVQRLLEDRFSLRVRRETRQMPIYALVRARPDGSLGPGLTPVTIDCADEVVRKTAPCGLRNAPNQVQATGMRWGFLTGQLVSSVNRIIVDRTGLSGQVNLSLGWTPELLSSADTAPSPDERVSIFTALQEQLGLKLESTTGPVEVLVIESVSRPTPD